MALNVSDEDRHRIVGGCMIHKPDKRFLIIKRHPDLPVYPGLWTVPAGGMERIDYEQRPKDSPDGWFNPLEEAVRREVREESGLEIGKLEYVNHYTFIRPDNIPVFGIHFAAPYVSGEVVLDPTDATDHAWILAEQVPDYEILGNIGENMIMFSKQMNW